MANFLVKTYWLVCLALFIIFFSAPLAAQKDHAKEDLKNPVVLEDLAYGNILFEYYRGNSIKALNAILVAQQKNLLPNHSQSARLLSGVIYLDLRMVSHAKQIFDELLAEEGIKNELLAKIEFYLGKLHYRQGEYTQANYRLQRVVNLLQVRLKDECLLMLANMALAKNQLASAKKWLLQVSEQSSLAAYTRYNLGVLFLREANLQEAEKFLLDLFPARKKSAKNQLLSPLGKSLQDKAKVALGYFYLANESFVHARALFAEVRLSSLQSSKAMLGMGWSYLQAGEYQKALSHWTALQQRDIRDIAVQEALLAIPYAYQKLASMQQALDHYLSAADIYQQQIDLIDELITQIDQQGLIEKFVEKIIDKKIVINDTDLKDSALFGDEFDYYLFELISQHDFNEGFKTYQKLGRLSNILDYWTEQLPLFDTILVTNEQRFSKKIIKADEYLKQDLVNNYQTQLNVLQKNIQDAKNNSNLLSLANKQQLDILARINRVIDKMETVPQDMISNQQKQTIRRAQGIIKWQLQQDKPRKIWQLEKQAIRIEEILAQITVTKSNLQNARNIAQNRFAGFEEKVAASVGKLEGLKQKINQHVGYQSGELKFLIKSVLLSRKQTLEHFLLQADLSIARLHEQAMTASESN